MRTTLKNRKGLSIVALVEEAPENRGLAFICHGFSGDKGQPHIASMAGAFLRHGITSVRFDATNSFGESDGDLFDARLHLHTEDFEDVIGWASVQPWYREPFYLAGHSLGGGAALSCAARFPGKVKGLAPTSTVLSSALMDEAHIRQMGRDAWESWRREGFIFKERDGRKGKVPFRFWGDFDLLLEADKIRMPVLLVVGSGDAITPPAHHKKIFDILPGTKKYHEISGAEHTFKAPAHLAELETVFENWIHEVESAA